MSGRLRKLTGDNTRNPPSDPLLLRSRLSERLATILRTEIRRGRWKDTLPSERHLSLEFAVGRPTLHLALQVLEREGLICGQAAHPWTIITGKARPHHVPIRHDKVLLLRDGRTIPDPTSNLLFHDNLRQRLHRIGLDLVIVNLNDRSLTRQVRTLKGIEADHRPAFYLLASLPVDVYRWYQTLGVPAMILGIRPPEVQFPAIDFDTPMALRHAVNYLVRHGHRHMNLLQPDCGVGAVASRETFIDACVRHASRGVEWRCETIAVRPFTIRGAVLRLLGDHAPGAIIVKDNLAFVVALYTLLGQMGLQIPAAVSVVSIGWWPLLDTCFPVPTCYTMPKERLVNMILRTIEDQRQLGVCPDVQRHLLPVLRKGQSVRGA